MKQDGILRVGIIGTGWIADKAAITLNGLSNCEAYAVGSRTKETAEAFANNYGIPHAYGSYSELIADPDVDLVYIGTPHSHHYDVTREALLADKPCLVEKAFMANARQTEDILSLAMSISSLPADRPLSTAFSNHARCHTTRPSISCNSWMACARSGAYAIRWTNQTNPASISVRSC